MNIYASLASGIANSEAASLCTRLAAWHDAMVAHERRLRTESTSDLCDEECPHVEARVLWDEALTTFGPRAHELTFLRSRGSAAAREAARDDAARVARKRGPANRPAPGVPASGDHRNTSALEV